MKTKAEPKAKKPTKAEEKAAEAHARRVRKAEGKEAWREAVERSAAKRLKAPTTRRRLA